MCVFALSRRCQFCISHHTQTHTHSRIYTYDCDKRRSVQDAILLLSKTTMLEWETYTQALVCKTFSKIVFNFACDQCCECSTNLCSSILWPCMINWALNLSENVCWQPEWVYPRDWLHKHDSIHNTYTSVYEWGYSLLASNYLWLFNALRTSHMCMSVALPIFTHITHIIVCVCT